jgi:hypothetical protein
MDQDTNEDFQSVYQGYDSVLAGMLARMLEAEGITCRHIGTHYPAEIGVGALACEQRLEVSALQAERARELIAAAGATEGATEEEASED